MKYAPLAKQTAAGAVLAAEELDTPAALLLVEDVHVAYAAAASFFHPVPRAQTHSVHATAVVHPEAVLATPVEIGPYVTLGKCRIGAGTVVRAHSHVGDDVVVGEQCTIYEHVTIYPGCRLGQRVILQSGCVVGGDGFGFARGKAGWIKVPQLGGVVLHDDVELQSGVNVDRGALGDTVIGAGCKIDSACHIAHNVVLGEHVVLAAGTSIAGSTRVGDRCIFGGMVGVSGHLEICADVRLGGGAIAFKDITEPGEYMGVPLLEMREHVRLLRKLRSFGRGDG